MDRLYSKYLKEKYTNKMKSILNFYSQKQNMNNNYINKIDINKNKKKHLYSSFFDNKNKNNKYIKRNKSTKIMKRNSSSQRNSLEENITIVNKIDVIPINPLDEEKKNKDTYINLENNKNTYKKEENNKNDVPIMDFLKRVRKKQINKDLNSKNN